MSLEPIGPIVDRVMHSLMSRDGKSGVMYCRNRVDYYGFPLSRETLQMIMDRWRGQYRYVRYSHIDGWNPLGSHSTGTTHRGKDMNLLLTAVIVVLCFLLGHYLIGAGMAGYIAGCLCSNLDRIGCNKESQ